MARTQQGSVQSQEVEASQGATVQEAQAAPQTTVATVPQPAAFQLGVVSRTILLLGAICLGLFGLYLGASTAGLLNRSLPVKSDVIASTWFSGKNLVTITSDWPRRLTIEATLYDYHGHPKEAKQFVLTGEGDTAKLGYWQGWNLEDGDSVVLSHPRFRSRTISFDAVLVQRGSEKAESIKDTANKPEKDKSSSGPVAAIW